ncbi:GIY-YIG nuclease family protein [Streptomyces cynarae]|uniref:GIY-YIG nuclease family protein n=1 Tax=Streptomyces cynarae TaxID=2981134 RepID=UPI00406C3ECF
MICGSPQGRAWGSYGPSPACQPCHLDVIGRQRAALEAIPTCLYRLYDVFGRLLYVGITSNLARRWKEHRRDHQFWWYQVAERRLEWFPTRDRAWRAERQAVRAELPLHNGEAWGQFGNGGARPELPPGVPPRPKLVVAEEGWLDEPALRAHLMEVAVWRARLRDAALSPEELAVVLAERRRLAQPERTYYARADASSAIWVVPPPPLFCVNRATIRVLYVSFTRTPRAMGGP